MKIASYIKFEKRCIEINEMIIKAREEVDKVNFARYRFLAEYSRNYGIKESEFPKVYEEIIKKRKEDDDNWVWQLESPFLR